MIQHDCLLVRDTIAWLYIVPQLVNVSGCQARDHVFEPSTGHATCTRVYLDMKLFLWPFSPYFSLEMVRREYMWIIYALVSGYG